MGRAWSALPLFLHAGCLAESPQLELASGDAVTLVAELEDAGYRDWDPPPTSADLPHRREGVGPHGPWIEVYLHPDLIEVFLSEEPLDAWPVGVAAVCESYAEEDAEAPYLINAMRKEEGGWAWAQLDADGQPLTDTRPDDCIGCHGAGDDYVFSVFLRSE